MNSLTASPPPAALPDAVQALLQSRPRLRRLGISFQRMEGLPTYVLEDPGTSTFFRAGEREYRFLERLDGRRTVHEILTRLAAAAPGEALDPASAFRLLDALRAERLLDEPMRPADGSDPRRRDLFSRLGNLLFLRISLGNPDRFFLRLSRWMGWVTHPLAWCAGLALIAVGGGVLLRHADRVRDATLGVLWPGQWLGIALVFVALRAIHEIWHGLTCRRWGGAVRDIGIVLIVFFPVGYVDVTSGWALPSRWRRFGVSSAGIFIELCLASIAALAWAHTDPGPVNTLAWQVVITAGVSAVLVNLNPLQRFDGYYMATDALDLPNLYTRGQIVTRALWSRFGLGLRGQELPPLREAGWRVAAFYGPATAAWRAFMMVNILAAAGALFRGAGVAIVCLTLAVWFRGSSSSALKGFKALPAGARAGAALRLLLLVSAAAGLLLLPWRPPVVEPAVMDWADRCDVYAGCPGILEAMSVPPGSRVEAGTELARIGNPDVEAEAELLRIREARETLRAAVALREGEMPSWSAAVASVEALAREREHAGEKARRRIVRAPAAGVVYKRRQEIHLGQRVREGEPLFTLGHAVDREAVALIPHQRLVQYGLRLDDEVDVWMPASPGLRTGRVASLEPSAGQQIEHPALTLLGGGHLAVKPLPRDEQNDEGRYELESPHFKVRVKISGSALPSLLVGERVFIRMRSIAALPLWRFAYDGLDRFWSNLLTRRSRSATLDSAVKSVFSIAAESTLSGGHASGRSRRVYADPSTLRFAQGELAGASLR